jgi:hypothetical protein
MVRKVLVVYDISFYRVISALVQATLAAGAWEEAVFGQATLRPDSQGTKRMCKKSSKWPYPMQYPRVKGGLCTARLPVLTCTTVLVRHVTTSAAKDLRSLLRFLLLLLLWFIVLCPALPHSCYSCLIPTGVATSYDLCDLKDRPGSFLSCECGIFQRNKRRG